MDEIPSSPKKVDEEWKERVAREKESASSTRPRDRGPDIAEPVDFMYLVSTLALQAYVALGEVADPNSGEKIIELRQAKTVIDLLGVLEQKTKGNLSGEEEEALTNVLYELRMKFVARKGTVKP